MSQMLQDLLRTQKQLNRKTLRHFYTLSLMTGVNIKYKTNFKDPVKIINAALVSVSMVSLCAQYCLVWYNRHKSFVESADAICSANQGWISVLKLIYLAFVQHKMYDLVNCATNCTLLYEVGVFDLALNCKPKLLLEMKNVLIASWLHIKRQLNIFSFLCLMACGLYMFPCIFLNYYYTNIQPKNITLQLPLPALFPMWHDYGMTWPYYPIQYLITGIQTYICGMSAVCFDGLFIIIVGHCLALFEILHKLLDHITDEDVPQSERVQYLICCVRLHEQIYRYYEKVNALYRNPSLVQCMLTTFGLCVVMFTINFGLEEDITLFVKMLFFLFAATYQISIYCFNGQKIMTLSERSPSHWYNCCWYDESEQFKYILNMMILRSSRTFHLQVSDFTTMSHETFLSIIQTSCSYFLILKNLNDVN